MTSSIFRAENDPNSVRTIHTPTDAVLIRALGPDERAGCAVLAPTSCQERGMFELACYDPESVIDDERSANYCGAIYACSIDHAITILRNRATDWFPGAGVTS